MLSISMGKGFQMVFKNGIRASVQFGPGNYCDNYDLLLKLDPKDPYKPPKGGWKSTNAEVAAIDDTKGGTVWMTKEIMGLDEDSDDVIGRVETEQVLDFLNKCRDYKRK